MFVVQFIICTVVVRWLLWFSFISSWLPTLGLFCRDSLLCLLISRRVYISLLAGYPPPLLYILIPHSFCRMFRLPQSSCVCNASLWVIALRLDVHHVLRASPKILGHIHAFIEVSCRNGQVRCCCCFHINNRSGLRSVPSRIRSAMIMFGNFWTRCNACKKSALHQTEQWQTQ